MLKSFVEVDREFRRRAIQSSAQEKELRLLRERINQLAGLTNPSEVVIVYADETGGVVTAGAGLTGGGALPCTIDVAGGGGITVLANSVAVNLAYHFYWSGVHNHSNNIVMDKAAGDSPYISFVGGTSDDTAYIYLDNDIHYAEDSDLVVKLCDARTDGDSWLEILDKNNTLASYMTSSGDVAATADMYVGEYIFHYGDVDTYHRFRADQQTFAVGGRNVLDITTTDIEFNAGSNDVNFVVQSDTHADALVVDGGTGVVTLGELATGYVYATAGVLSEVAAIPLADLTSYSRGALIVGGLADWQAMVHPGAAGRALSTDANDVGWYNQPSWAGEHTFEAGLEVSDDQDITLGDGDDATIQYDSGDDEVEVGGVDWMFVVDNFSITSSSDTKPQFSIIDTHGGSNCGEIVFYKDSASPLDNDDLGVVEWWGNDDGSGMTRFAYLLGEALDVSAGAEAAHLNFVVRVDGAERSMLQLAGYNGGVGQAEVVVNQSGTDCDFRVESDVDVDALFVRGSDSFVGLCTSAPDVKFHVRGGDGMFDRGATASGLTRNVTIGGARTASGSDYAQLDFENYDGSDYIGARISSQNDNDVSDGDLRFWTYDGSLTEQFRIKSDGTGYFVGDLGIGHDTPAEKVEIRDTSTQLRLAYDGTDYVNLTVTTSSLEISGPDIGYVKLIDPVNRLVWDDIGGGSGIEGALYDDSGSNQRYWLMFNSNTVILCNRAASGSVQFRANNAAGGGGESTIAEYFYNVTEFYVDIHLERSSGSPEIQFTDTSDSDYFELWHEQSNDRFRIASNSIDPIVTITKAGLVGIGVNALAPTAKLHVVQDVLSGPGPVALLLSQADVDQPFIEFTTGTMYTGKSTTNYYLKVKAPDGNEYYLRLFED